MSEPNICVVIKGDAQPVSQNSNAFAKNECQNIAKSRIAKMADYYPKRLNDVITY